MRILIYAWKVFHQKAVIENLREMGYEVDIFDEGENAEDVSVEEYSRSFEDRLINIHYDFVMTINYYGRVSNACDKHNIKYVAWTCDSPLIAMHHKSIFNKCNYIFVFDMVNYYEFKQMGVKHIYYLPLAVDTRRYDNIFTTAADYDMERFKSDISFVGGLYAKNSYDDIADKLPPYLKGYFDAAMLAQMDIYGENIMDRLLTVDILRQLQEFIDFKQSENSMSDLALVFSTTFLGFKEAQLERINNLNLLAQKHKVDSCLRIIRWSCPSILKTEKTLYSLKA